MDFTPCGIPIRNGESRNAFPQNDLLNERRTQDELRKWWNVPYIDELSYEYVGAICVYVLDGETWDSPRKISEHASFQEAVTSVHFYVSHSPFFRRYHDPYQRCAKVEHLTEMSTFIHGNIGKLTENELFEYLFPWLPLSEDTQTEAAV